MREETLIHSKSLFSKRKKKLLSKTIRKETLEADNCLGFSENNKNVETTIFIILISKFVGYFYIGFTFA